MAHELGHAIHWLVLGSFGVDDFSEIPSTFLEHWISDARVLQRLSSGQAPLDVFKSVGANRYSSPYKVLSFKRTLWTSKFDLVAHSKSEEQLQGCNLGADCAQILKEWIGAYSIGGRINNEYLSWKSLRNYHTSYYCYLL